MTLLTKITVFLNDNFSNKKKTDSKVFEFLRKNYDELKNSKICYKSFERFLRRKMV